MGGAVSYEHNGTLIQFCCKPCIPKFQKNPDKYLVILREELEAVKKEKEKKDM
jgi:YHS domain-containing protein